MRLRDQHDEMQPNKKTTAAKPPKKPRFDTRTTHIDRHTRESKGTSDGGARRSDVVRVLAIADSSARWMNYM